VYLFVRGVDASGTGMYARNWIDYSRKNNPMMPIPDVLDLIHTWTARGWLRPIDRAFVMFLHSKYPSASSLVFLGAALASHQLGRGHICLDIGKALADPDGTLSLPPEGERGENMPAKPSRILCDLTPAAWMDQFAGSALVGKDTETTPLVLHGERLYLRRYWQYTRQVAREILDRAQQTLPVPDDLENRLDELFAELRTPEEKNKHTIHWQSVAAAVAAGSHHRGPGAGPAPGDCHGTGQGPADPSGRPHGKGRGPAHAIPVQGHGSCAGAPPGPYARRGHHPSPAAGHAS